MAGDMILKCSFCGKTQKQVKKLIAGPGVYICDECIDLCNEIIEEEIKPRVQRMPLSEEESSAVPPQPAPHLVGVAEIADILGVSRQRVAQLIASYEDFPRPEADIAAGRIWSRTAVETWIAAHPERRPGRTSKSELNLLGRLGKEAEEAMRAAAESARTLGHDATTTEHVLLGLFEPPGSGAARVLAELQITPEQIRDRLGAIAPTADPLDEPPTWDASVKRVIESAALAAFQAAESEIATEHLLLGILQDPQSPAARLLTSLGPTLGFVADRVFALRRSHSPEPQAPAPATPVIEELAQVIRTLTTEIAWMRDAQALRGDEPAPGEGEARE